MKNIEDDTMNKALVAMSGGVDSAVAALLTKNMGYECLGVTMKLYNNEDINVCTSKTCCSLDDIEDARSVAFKIGIPYRVFNFTDEFSTQVIDRFIRAYENGYTPNPCIDCNRYLKFEHLYNRAKILGYDKVVTGHYARIQQINGHYFLKKAVDEKKDQSYVLYSLTQEQLSHTIFPLGELRKTEVRKIAEENGFTNARKQDSQDICFVPDGDYAKFMEEYSGTKYPAGSFVDTDGNILGTHKGLIRYTIGQRKGLGLALPQPMYVMNKNYEQNTVTLCTNKELFTKELDADDFNWIALDKPSEPFKAKAKIRYNHAEEWCSIYPSETGTVHIVFDEPQRAITAGQAVVLYDGDTVLGGGIISL